MEGLIMWLPSLVWVVWALLLAFPLFFVLRRTGKSQWWVLLALFPILGGAALVWVIAFSAWPRLPAREQSVS